MKMKTIIALTLIICFIFVVPIALAYEESKLVISISTKKICVPDEETAIQIAEIILKRVYRDEVDFTIYYPYVKFNEANKEWIVFYTHFENTYTGGGPAIHIKMDNAEVTYIGLSV